MSVDTKKDQEFRTKFVSAGKVTWRVYVAAFVLGLIGILLERQVPGISRSLGSAEAALFGIIIVKRRYWQHWWFWITFIILAVLQLPLAVVTKPIMDSLKFVFMWIFALVDLFAMSFAIELTAAHFEES